MKPMQEALTNWAIQRITKYYPDDVALLIAVEGHALESDCHGIAFDYFIPATDRGYECATTFILDGVGHDLYPRSWDRINNMAMFDDDFHNGLADGIILYARSEEDRKQFEDYRQKQLANLNNPHFMYGKALEKLDAAMNLYSSMMFEDQLYQIRMSAGYITLFLGHAVAFINGQYFKQRLELPTIELALMDKLPAAFIETFEAIIEADTTELLKSLCYEIIKSTRDFLIESRPEISNQSKENTAIDYHNLAEWYQEGSLAFRRMYIHCDEGNYKRVIGDALTIQNEFNIIREEFDLKPMDLLSPFNSKDLTDFKMNAKNIEAYIIDTIEQHGVTINAYETLDEFLEHNS